METPEKIENPLKRSFETMESKSELVDTVDVDKDENFIPRMHQVEAFEVGMKRNTIAVFKTRAEKTLIAVMMIKEIGKSIELNGEKKLIIFLAPTVHLVHQQYEGIKFHTVFKVEEYYGAKGVDHWNRETWEKEVAEHDILVMTPQILFDALRKSFLSLNAVCLMILDECHHATGNHPYVKIMKEFYHKSSGAKPKIFGMTASPVIYKCETSAQDCEWKISELESFLDSQIYRVGESAELDGFLPSAKEIHRFYDPSVPSNLELKKKLACSWSKFHAVLLDLQSSSPVDKHTDIKIEMLRQRLSSDHVNISCCLEDLGLLCAYEAVKVCIDNAPNDEVSELYKKSSLQLKYYLEEVLSIIEESLPQDHEKLVGVGCNYSKNVIMGYISSKLHELLKIFNSFGEADDVLCLILFDQIITAKVIERIMKKLSFLSHFTVSYMTESNSSVDALKPEAQKQSLDSFRLQRVNLLFAIDVVEKGIHVPYCSLVVQFDLPKTVQSYIQSRGLARQNGSQYIIMLERGNIKQRDDMFNLIRSEFSMMSTTINRDPDASIVKAFVTKDSDQYNVDANGASLAADSSVDIIYRYCASLPADKYFIPQPKFEYILVGNLYQCELTLPPSAAFKTIIGKESENTHSAKKLVCLEACKKLHQMGALNNHLLPLNEETSETNSRLKNKALTSGEGTTKRKELHGTTSIQMLSGTWGDTHDGFLFESYKIDFSCNIAEQRYSSFVLLLELKLDDDVGNMELELFLLSKFVMSSVSAAGHIYLHREQVAKAKCFQEFFFNGLFGKLFIKSSGERQFLFQANEVLWNPSNMYLLLPLESSNKSETWGVDWRPIESSISTIEFLKKHAWLSVEQSESNRKSMLTHRPDPVGNGSENCNIIHLANKSVSITDLKGMVVVAIHTGRIYTILEAVDKTSGETCFDGCSDTDPANYLSFSDYFSKKYGIVLVHPGQPLLLLKQSHNAHNLLVDFRKQSTSSGKKLPGGSVPMVEKPRHNVHMPPELLVSMDVDTEILKGFYLLPSLMHRLESLMLASQLRGNISSHSPNMHISSSLILEALTTLRCSESFSMERLELLGDSVLKYTVSCHLFLIYPGKHEGQLSSERQHAVCNSTLHKLGINRKLQGYIRDSAFDPRRWTAPGQRSVRHFPCEHGVVTPEVPLDEKFITEDTKVVVGKCCDNGHRWMVSKTISDCVEALIGAYYVGGGLTAAIQLMVWLGADAQLEPSLLDKAIESASLHTYSPKVQSIQSLEIQLGYEFTVKGLLLEAITHGTEEQDAGVCYERLEFLGDAVLDILITRYLFQNHSEIDQGELTDLRSASVCNDNFALAAVRHNLHLHLQHCSGFLEDHISKYVKAVSASSDDIVLLQSTKAPKVLSDLVESIAGAVLIDSKLNLDEVWRVFKPLLSPIVTPDKLELPPLRELNELCDSLGYFIKENFTPNGDGVQAELILQLEELRLVGKGFGQTRKAAKGQAALHLLKNLERHWNDGLKAVLERDLKSFQLNEKRGISNPKRKKEENGTICIQENNEATTQSESHKKKKIFEPTGDPPSSSDLNGYNSNKMEIPVVAPINMKKGGPRISLFELCKKLQWPMPDFQFTEYRSRTPIVFGEGSEQRIGFNSFEAQIKLTLPNSGVVELTGDPKADKKSASDSAALRMLHELEGQGRIIISK